MIDTSGVIPLKFDTWVMGREGGGLGRRDDGWHGLCWIFHCVGELFDYHDVGGIFAGRDVEWHGLGWTEDFLIFHGIGGIFACRND